MKTVVGLFDTFNEARDVVSALTDAGFNRDAISLVANDASGEYKQYATDGGDAVDATGAGATTGAVVGGTLGVLAGLGALGALVIPGVGPVIAAGPLLAGAAGAGVGALTGGLLGALADAGVPDEDAEYYTEGVRRGGTLVMVRAEEDEAQKAADIMNRNNAVNVQERSAAWRNQGWTGYDQNAEAYTSDQIATEHSYYTNGMAYGTSTMTTTDEDEMAIPVVEEELRIGKRQVEGGGVRVSSQVVEEPISEDVRLRDEHVHVERRPVNRDATAQDFDSFREGTIELTEMHEEAVVDKRARVVEEVVVRKDVDEHTETVRDTVRHTEVNIEEMDKNFRTNYDTNYANSGYTYEQYTPAYRYGSELADNASYRGREWTDVENDARARWEERNPGTWDQFKDAVRHAWDEVRGRV